MTTLNSPLAEAAHLHRLAEEYSAKVGPDDPSGTALAMTDGGRAALMYVEAQALERGYRLGRVMAAADVRIGLDRSFANGGVHFDSDVEPPPEWLMRAAEKLARGDA